MNSRLEIKLWLAHRLSAMALGLFVLIHLITMIVVIQGGLSAAEIMDRTSSNVLVMVFYGLFVIAAAVHGAIGLRTVSQEVLKWRGASLDMVILAFFVLLSGLGMVAIKGLVL